MAKKTEQEKKDAAEKKAAEKKAADEAKAAKKKADAEAKAKKEAEAKAKADDKAKKTQTLVFVHPVSETENGTVTLFGREATKNKNGHYEVVVLASQVKNETSRIQKRLITTSEYKEFLADKEK